MFPDLPIPLVGLAIGDGFVDPPVQVLTRVYDRLRIPSFGILLGAPSASQLGIVCVFVCVRRLECVRLCMFFFKYVLQVLAKPQLAFDFGS